MPFSLETCAWAVSALFQFLAGSIPRVPRNYPYPQNFGTFGDTSPVLQREAPTESFDLVMTLRTAGSMYWAACRGRRSKTASRYSSPVGCPGRSDGRRAPAARYAVAE